MNKQQIEGLYHALRMHLGTTRRLVDQFPEDKINFRPVPEVRTAAEIAGHIYNFLTEATETVLAGKHIPREPPAFQSKAELLAYMDSQLEKAYANLTKITEQQVGATITAYGTEFPGWQMLGFVYDELLHHRGQLTVYLRLLSIPPIFIYDMEG